jgi:hypothetical protein
MDYVVHLQQILRVLGCYRPPVYMSRDNVVNGVKNGVIYTLTLYRIASEEDGASKSFAFQTRRESMEEAIQETARLAILDLARDQAAELATTVYRLHPAAQTGEAPALQHPRGEGEEDASVEQLASFSHRTATELAHVQVAMNAALERIDQLERTQAAAELARTQAALEAAQEKIAEQSGALHVAQQKIAELEKALFAGSPRDENLVLEEEEAPPVQ